MQIYNTHKYIQIYLLLSLYFYLFIKYINIKSLTKNFNKLIFYYYKL